MLSHASIDPFHLRVNSFMAKHVDFACGKSLTCKLVIETVMSKLKRYLGAIMEVRCKLH